MGNENFKGFELNDDGTVVRNPDIDRVRAKLSGRNNTPESSSKKGWLWGIIAVLILLVLGFFVFKSSGNGPGAVAERAMNNMINGNYESFVNACDLGEDTLSVESLNAQKQMMFALLKKSIDDVKTGDNEDAKQNLPSSCSTLDESVDSYGNEANVTLEVTTVGGETKTKTVKLKKNSLGEWKITNCYDIMPKVP